MNGPGEHAGGLQIDRRCIFFYLLHWYLRYPWSICKSIFCVFKQRDLVQSECIMPTWFDWSRGGSQLSVQPVHL